MRWIALVLIVVALAGCTGGGSVQGSGGDRSSQGRVGWRLAL